MRRPLTFVDTPRSGQRRGGVLQPGELTAGSQTTRGLASLWAGSGLGSGGRQQAYIPPPPPTFGRPPDAMPAAQYRETSNYDGGYWARHTGQRASGSSPATGPYAAPAHPRPAMQWQGVDNVEVVDLVEASSAEEGSPQPPCRVRPARAAFQSSVRADDLAALNGSDDASSDGSEESLLDQAMATLAPTIAPADQFLGTQPALRPPSPSEPTPTSWPLCPRHGSEGAPVPAPTQRQPHVMPQTPQPAPPPHPSLPALSPPFRESSLHQPAPLRRPPPQPPPPRYFPIPRLDSTPAPMPMRMALSSQPATCQASPPRCPPSGQPPVQPQAPGCAAKQLPYAASARAYPPQARHSEPTSPPPQQQGDVWTAHTPGWPTAQRSPKSPIAAPSSQLDRNCPFSSPTTQNDRPMPSSYAVDRFATSPSWGNNTPPLPITPILPPDALLHQPITNGRMWDNADSFQWSQAADEFSSRQNLSGYAPAHRNSLQASSMADPHAAHRNNLRQAASMAHSHAHHGSSRSPPSVTAPRPPPASSASRPESTEEFARAFLRADGRSRHEMISRCLGSWTAATARSPAAAARCQDNLKAAVRASTDSPARLAFVDEIAAAFILGMLFPACLVSSAPPPPPVFNARPGLNSVGSPKDESGVRLAAGWLQIHPRGTALPQGLAAALQGAHPGSAARPGSAATTSAPYSGSKNSANSSNSISGVLRIIHRIVTAHSRAAEVLLPRLLASSIAAAQSPAIAVGAPNPRLVGAMEQARALARMMEAAGMSPYDEAVDRAFGEADEDAAAAA